MKKEQKLWKLQPGIVVLLISLFLVSCGQSTDISIAYQDRIGDAPFILMSADETYQKEYEWSQFSSGPETAEALLTGSVKIATMGDSTALQILSRYPGLYVMIGSHASGANRHRIVVSSSDDSIQTIRDLEGKNIAVKKGTSTHGALILLEQELKISLTSQLTDLKPGLQLSALSAGEVDAIIASEPTPSIADAASYGRVLSAIDVEGLHFPLVLMAEKNWALNNRDEIELLLNRLDLIYKRINTPESLSLMLQVTNLDKDVLESALSFHEYRFISADNLVDELSILHSSLSEEGYFDALPEWEKSLFLINQD
jgi:NitT/TauT family transport system substrate-binding protein